MKHGTLIILLILAALVGADPAIAQTPQPDDALQGAPPPVPTGYANMPRLFAALAVRQTQGINVTAPIPADIRMRSNVTYGRGGRYRLQLDLFEPKKKDRPVPGLVFIHGGGWRGGQKEEYRYYGVSFAQAGYVVASIDYRLSWRATYPAAVHDAKCAVRWMRANAKKLGVDPDRIGIVGGSAGGHLAMMVAYTSDIPEFEGDGGHAGVSSKVQAVVDIYGPTDLTTRHMRMADLVSSFIGQPYLDAPQLYEQASPLRYVTQDDPPTLILHGTADQLVPISQSEALVESLKEQGVPYEFERFEGWPHAMDLAQPINDRCQWFMKQFLTKSLGDGE